MAKYTPMMEQYFQIKNKYKYALLFYRLGDFYELFYDDAKIASRELDLVLTGKNVGTEERAPMCGVPYHAADNYIAKLVNSGFKVAVCEQVEDPKLAKGLVKREVIRVITPGTIMDTNALQADKNNYIMSVFGCKAGFGVSACDITTGAYFATEFGTDGFNKVIDEIAKFSPSEIICSGIGEENMKRIENIFSVKPSPYSEYNFDLGNADITLCNHFNVLNLNGFGLEKRICAVSAAGALLSYVKEAQKNGLENLRSIKYYERTGGMILDIGSRRNLELTETVRDKSKKGSLLWVLDSTKTSMGARLLRSRLEQPLTDKITIEKRLDGVELMKNDLQKRTELRENLKQIYDIERIMGKLVYGSAHGRDMAALRASLSFMPKLREILSGFDCAFIQDILSNWDDLTDVYTLLCDSIAEEPPLGIKDVGVIKTGYDPELDKLREAMEKGTGWLMEMEASEREKTGIKNLKIRFNKVHGYYIEVSNSYLNQVPDTYIRRQTLTTGERFINPELKELEETLLTAEDRLTTLEAEIFAKIKQKTADEYSRVMQQAALVSEADFIQSLAETADNCNYAKPVITNENIIKITNGRHPVVERQDGCQYIPNDTDIDKNTNTVSIITGPNMAGKSTYMRQTALIVLMAQIGSFVPADAAEIGITDRIFTRVGASDDLATGQSTFMVEMVEVANILNNATENSLLILDELGRGTSTFDGMSIAWAVIEHIAKKIKARTLFSTHYQELTALSDRLENVKNYCVSVMEQGEDVIFLRKIKEGSADKSYGVHVAKLAGVPKSVVRRANQVLSILCSSGLDVSVNDKGEYVDPEVYNDEKVKKYAEIAEYLEDLDMDEVSPKEAWEKLNTLCYMAKAQK